MGFRFRKSIKLLPGVKLNINKKSTSLTLGGKGIHYTINSKGKRTASVGIPGTGLYYTETATTSPASTTELREKNKWIALSLCFFTFFGHKFYEGKIGMGFLYMFTFGLFGFGWITDLIKLITKPNPYYV